MPELAHKRQLTSTVYGAPLMTPTTDFDVCIRLSMFELCETGDWHIFLNPPERARAETGGAGQKVFKRREFPGFARVNKVTPTSLGYPLSVFNNNCALKHKTTMGLTVLRVRGDPYTITQSNDRDYGLSRGVINSKLVRSDCAATNGVRREHDGLPVARVCLKVTFLERVKSQKNGTHTCYGLHTTGFHDA